MTIIALEADLIHDIAIVTFPTITIRRITLTREALNNGNPASCDPGLYPSSAQLEILGISITTMATETGIDDIVIEIISTQLTSSGV